MIEQTETKIAAIAGKVVIGHSKLVGRQYLTPDQARTMAEALLLGAEAAEAQLRAAAN